MVHCIDGPVPTDSWTLLSALIGVLKISEFVSAEWGILMPPLSSNFHQAYTAALVFSGLTAIFSLCIVIQMSLLPAMLVVACRRPHTPSCSPRCSTTPSSSFPAIATDNFASPPGSVSAPTSSGIPVPPPPPPTPSLTTYSPPL